MKVVTFLNEKGGVGKTTNAIHVAAGLAIKGKRVIILDADPQGHATLALGLEQRPALHDMIVRQANFQDVLQLIPPTVYAPNGESKGQLFVVPGDIETRAIPMLVSDVWRLRNRLKRLESAIDYVVIDTAPTPSLFHSMIYMTTDFIIYPTKCERLSFDGLVKSLQHTEEANMSRQPNIPPITPLGILPTMYRKQTVEHSENLKMLKTEYSTRVWEPMHNSIIWAEASTMSQTVFALAPDSGAAKQAWNVVTKVMSA